MLQSERWFPVKGLVGERGSCNQDVWTVRWQIYCSTLPRPKAVKREEQWGGFACLWTTCAYMCSMWCPIKVSYSPQTCLFTILYIRAWSPYSAQPVKGFSVFPRVCVCLHRSNSAKQKKQKKWQSRILSLFGFWLLLVGPRLPAHRLHIHSAVSTRTAELSVSWYFSVVFQKTICLHVTVLLRLSYETDCQCWKLCITKTCDFSKLSQLFHYWKCTCIYNYYHIILLDVNWNLFGFNCWCGHAAL